MNLNFFVFPVSDFEISFYFGYYIIYVTSDWLIRYARFLFSRIASLGVLSKTDAVHMVGSVVAVYVVCVFVCVCVSVCVVIVCLPQLFIMYHAIKRT